MMRVEQAEMTVREGAVRIAGTVGGQELYWSLPRTPGIELRGEPFVAALLPAAMRVGATIELPDQLPLDASFRENIDRLQTIMARWFDGLNIVAIRARTAPRQVTTAGIATGYSGGIDSSYTVDTLTGRIDTVLLVDGIEYPERSATLADQVAETLTAVMARRNIGLLRLNTNVKSVQRALGAHWPEAIGGAIASCVHVAGFQSYQIAASNSWENLRPYGSHPLTDPLWSSAAVRIGHHGAELRRIEKIRYLGGVPDLLERIRVCFQGTDYNCGTCQKCLQTAAGFRALELTSASVPPLTDPLLLRRAAVEHDGDLVDWVELLLPDLAERDPDLHRQLDRLIRRYRWRKVGRDIDYLLTGGRLRRYLRSRRRRG